MSSGFRLGHRQVGVPRPKQLPGFDREQPGFIEHNVVATSPGGLLPGRSRRPGRSQLPARLSRHVKKDTVLGVALATYCSAQIALVSEALQRRAHVYRGVHEARKGIRRLRSVIVLGTAHFGPTGAGVDGALRSLGRSLSVVRDAQAARDCAHRKVEDAASPEQRALWQRMTIQLASARSRTMRQVRAKDVAFLQRQSAIARIGERISLLPWTDVGLRAVRAQLRRSAKRAGRAADCYLEEPRLTSLHRLRRRLRRYRMQIEALSTIHDAPASAPVNKDIVASVGKYLSWFKQISRRVDQLGELIDLHLLRTALRRLPASADRTLALASLRQQKINMFPPIKSRSRVGQ